MLRPLFFIACVVLAACGGDADGAPANRPATLGSFEQTYGILAGTSHGMSVLVTTSTGTAGFAVFTYDAQADRGEVSYVVCVAKPCPTAGEEGAVSFKSEMLSVVERYEDQAVFRTAPGAATAVSVSGGRLRNGVPTEIIVDVLDAPKAHLEGALYPFTRVE